MTVASALKKIAVGLLTDPKVFKTIGGIVLGIIIIIAMPVIAVISFFDGDIESVINNLSLEVPSLEGDTGIAEVGVSMKPSLNSHWSLDLGAKGYVGDREGVVGNAVIRYAF